MIKEIKNYGVHKKIESVILSCKFNEQLLNCEKWVAQLKLGEIYESYFYSLIALQQSKFITENYENTH